MPHFIVIRGATDPISIATSQEPGRAAAKAAVTELGTLPQPCVLRDLILYCNHHATLADAEAEQTTFDGQGDKLVWAQDKALMELTDRGFINTDGSNEQLKTIADRLRFTGFSGNTIGQMRTLLARS